MVVRMKHSKGKRNRVRSHHALKKKAFSVCSHCKAEGISHIVCKQCGYYNGRQVIDVLKKTAKKEKKHQHTNTEESKKEHTHAHA